MPSCGAARLSQDNPKDRSWTRFNKQEREREEPNSGYPKDFASVGALGLLTRLEVTHVYGLTIRIKRAFHKARLTRDARGVGDLGWSRRRGRSRRRSDRNRRWGRRGICRGRSGSVLTRHRSVGIGRLHYCRSSGVIRIDVVNIRGLLLSHSITWRHIKRATTTAARWW